MSIYLRILSGTPSLILHSPGTDTATDIEGGLDIVVRKELLLHMAIFSNLINTIVSRTLGSDSGA